MKILWLLAAVLLLAGCGGGKDQQQETLDTMNSEMPLEERVALCDGYGYDPDFTYFVWEQRWEDIFDPAPPDRDTFDEWIEQDVCVDSEFVGGEDA